jgi:putative ABC transport system permease protein
VETYIDLPAYMDLTALNTLLREAPRANMVNVLVDETREDEFFRKLKRIPTVSAVMYRQAAVDNFRNTMGETIVIFVNLFGAFAAALGFGVVYNSARITLSERGRELASLRVLGFSRSAISYILLGEVALLILVALPVGCLMGWSLAWFIVKTTFENEMFRLPLIIYPSSYALANVVTRVASAVSAALGRVRLDRLDLIAVLKTRE